MDIRFPLGLMFAMMGALLSGFGLVTASSPIYRQHSLGVNVNLWAGLGILASASRCCGSARTSYSVAGSCQLAAVGPATLPALPAARYFVLINPSR